MFISFHLKLFIGYCLYFKIYETISFECNGGRVFFQVFSLGYKGTYLGTCDFLFSINGLFPITSHFSSTKNCDGLKLSIFPSYLNQKILMTVDRLTQYFKCLFIVLESSLFQDYIYQFLIRFHFNISSTNLVFTFFDLFLFNFYIIFYFITGTDFI